MLLLVFADGDMCRAINQDVGSHQVWIDIKADRSVFTVLSGLLLELCHAVEPANARNAVEHPRQLSVLCDLTLVEDNVLLRIDSAGKERRGYLARGAR